MTRRLHVTTPLLLLALLASAEGGVPEADSLLTAAFQGSNDHPVWDVTMESIALLTPVVEIGWTQQRGWLGRAGSDPYAAETGHLAAGSLLMTQAVVIMLKYAIKRERPARDYWPGRSWA